MPQREKPLPSFAVKPGIPGALTLFVDTPDSPSLYYVIPSVAEESKMPTLDFLPDF